MEKLNLAGLQELFGRAILARAMRPEKRGKHWRRRPRANHPAGTKLVRSFIRRARGENTEYRRIYARLTGNQYGA